MPDAPRCPICDSHDLRTEPPFASCLACECVQQSWPFDARRRDILSRQAIAAPNSERIESARRIVDMLQSHVHGRRIYEVGFGDGAVLSAAALKSWQVAGIELAQASLACVPDLAATVEIGDFLSRDHEHGDDAGSYDVVLFSYSLEQMDDANAAMEGAAELLSHGGIVYVELVPLSDLNGRGPERARNELPQRVLFPEAEHVRELLWRHGLTIEDETTGVGWRWIARSR
ncbi:MAG: methyltransferase domain-containing protein [Planctomycetes bacterium]|nr:methyltransferase domain-containing protein [Planctomycetota bacterium]MCB9918035.1 methyltransferase domain-containing protein [Planctomycetota bacterium]